MESIISVKNINKNYRTRKPDKFLKRLFKPQFKKIEAVKKINFEILRGEAVAFLGPNGAGKTTTIKMMTGLIMPTSGETRVLGYNPFERDHKLLRRIGLVMGNKRAMQWDLTANQGFNLLKNIYNLESEFTKKRLHELSSLLGVEDLLDTQIRNMSLGERMKMELIGSILHKPEILFLDEPTIGLDILTKKKVRKFLRQIQKEDRTTLILTSHDIDDIEAVCDRVIVINKGEKCYDDKIENLTTKYQQNKYLRFDLENELTSENIKKIKEWAEINKEDKESTNSYLFKTIPEHMINLISYLISNTVVLDMQIESVPLEDVIADLFKSA